MRARRDLEDMMVERGLSIDHTAIYRWVQHFAPIIPIIRKLYEVKALPS